MEEYVFHPSRRFGRAFHVIVIGLFAGAAGLGLWGAGSASMGPALLLYLLPALLSLPAIPLLAYRLNALQNASYTLERDGLRMRWGWRLEDIPMDAVLWVHTRSELAAPPPMPWIYWPGAVLGVRRLEGGEEASEVEYLASGARNLIYVATAQRIFAISPDEPAAFLSAFERFTELGSLTPLPSRSVYPELLFSRVWATPPARFLLLGGLLLGVLLAALVGFSIPSRQAVPLVFSPQGSPGERVPSNLLVLLPVLNSAFFLADFTLGLFLFRRDESQPLAYLLWGSGAVTAALFIAAVFFILSAG